jgi:hypothetical protein
MLLDVNCIASLTFPPEVGELDGPSICPVCCAPIELGYGGRIPTHPMTSGLDAPVEDGKERATAATATPSHSHPARSAREVVGDGSNGVKRGASKG